VRFWSRDKFWTKDKPSTGEIAVVNSARTIIAKFMQGRTQMKNQPDVNGYAHTKHSINQTTSALRALGLHQAQIDHVLWGVMMAQDILDGDGPYTPADYR
jgi:hypothetical protein